MTLTFVYHYPYFNTNVHDALILCTLPCKVDHFTTFEHNTHLVLLLTHKLTVMTPLLGLISSRLLSPNFAPHSLFISTIHMLSFTFR